MHLITMNAQDLSTEFKTTYDLDAEVFVGVDEFKSIYYINENILYKKTAEKLFSYSNVELGKLSMVNIQNPFKIILFYADFNTAIILDNNLNELTQQFVKHLYEEQLKTEAKTVNPILQDRLLEQS